jgi:type II secretory pathway component PulM
MKPTFTHTLAAMPARQLNMLAIGVVAIAAALAWTLALRAPLTALRLQQVRLAGLSATAAAAAAATGTGTGAAPPAALASAAALQPPPAAPAPLDLIAAVSASARAAGLAVGSAVPGPERSVAGLRQQTLDIQASGDYGAILAWLDDIEARQGAVGITHLELRPAPDEPRRQVQLQLATYGAEGKQ